MREALISLFLTLMSPGGYHLDRAIPYGDGPRRTLDVYRPKQVAPGTPVVVFFYGGSWDSGTRGFYRFVGAVLAREGVVAVIPDYRVYPEVKWPAFIEDSADAVAWAKAHAADYGADPGRLILMGHSAGAYNAAELAFDRRWLNRVGMSPSDISAMVGISGPYDFLPLRSDRLKIIFGPEAERPDTQPINHVDGSGPPALLLTGAADDIVDPGNTPRMAARIRATGGSVEDKTYPRLGHADTLASLLPVFRGKAPVLADVIAFIRAIPARTQKMRAA